MNSLWLLSVSEILQTQRRVAPVLLHRTLTALVGVLLVMTAVWFGSPWLTVMAAAAAVIGVCEAYRLYPPVSAADGDQPPTPLPVLLGGTWAVALVLAGELAVRPHDFGVAALVICVAGCIIGGLWMIAAWHGRRPVLAAVYLVIPPVYVGGALACAVAMRGMTGEGGTLPLRGTTVLDAPATIAENRLSGLPEIADVWLLPNIVGTDFAKSVASLADLGCWLLLLAILAMYAAGSGACAVRRLTRRHRDAPGVDLVKTWEVVAGGMAAAVIAAALGVLFPLHWQFWQGALVGVVLGVIASAGDFLESRVKRLADAKDSGRLFPGYGGMLDCLDRLLPSVAIVYILVVGIAAAR